MNSMRKFAWLAASALAVFFGAAQAASAQSVGYYDHNGYYHDGYDDRYYDDRYYDNRYYDNRYDAGYRGGLIRCESRNQRTVYCRLGYRGGNVRLVNQLSRNACIRGRTWGVSGDRVWVTRGCRGQFRIGDYYGHYDRYRDNRHGYGYGNTARMMVCESRDGRYNFCRGYGYVGQAQLRRQLSNARCQFDYSWGYRNDGVWVDRGCRAEFLLY